MSYRDVILADTPYFYTRNDCNTNASANFTPVDISGNNRNLPQTSSAVIATVPGLLYGDSNPAYQVSPTGIGLRDTGHAPTSGNNPWSMECLFQFASNPGSNQTLMAFGGVSGSSVNLTLT